MSALDICAVAPPASARSAIPWSASAWRRNASWSSWQASSRFNASPPGPVRAAEVMPSATSRPRGAGGADVPRLRPHTLDFKVEHPGGIEAHDVALRLVAEERDRRDRARRVEVPVRPVGREQQLGL